MDRDLWLLFRDYTEGLRKQSPDGSFGDIDVLRAMRRFKEFRVTAIQTNLLPECTTNESITRRQYASPPYLVSLLYKYTDFLDRMVGFGTDRPCINCNCTTWAGYTDGRSWKCHGCGRLVYDPVVTMGIKRQADALLKIAGDCRSIDRISRTQINSSVTPGFYVKISEVKDIENFVQLRATELLQIVNRRIEGLPEGYIPGAVGLGETK